MLVLLESVTFRQHLRILNSSSRYVVKLLWVLMAISGDDSSQSPTF